MQPKLIAGLVLALAISVLAGFMFYYRSEAISAKADLDTALAANKAQAETITTLEALRVTDGKVIVDLTKRVASLNAEADKKRRKITQLERADNEVRAYLATPIPASLVRLLNDADNADR